ncbi:SPW repeat domain-containing protein [Amycolatopsis keratiniphila]|nr:SPW repeat protein [Amycolatopsis keratiniphila]
MNSSPRNTGPYAKASEEQAVRSGVNSPVEPMPPGRYGYSSAPPPMFTPRPEPFLASLPSGLAFLTGIWLITAPFVLDYTFTGPARPGVWNDIVIEVTVAVLALVRAVSPREIPWASLVNVVLGGWLVAAPFVLDYNEGFDASRAVTSDVIAGVLVIVFAGLSALITFRGRPENDHTS